MELPLISHTDLTIIFRYLLTMALPVEDGQKMEGGHRCINGIYQSMGRSLTTVLKYYCVSPIFLIRNITAIAVTFMIM